MQDTLTAEHLFATIDARDSAGFAALLHDDAVFHFGNAAPVQGRDAIREAVAGFFSSITSVQHDLVQVWRPPGALICHGTVTYTRHDGSALSVPFANVLALEGDKARDYRIYADISALYAEAGPG